MSITIEEGKFYRTREWGKVGPAKRQIDPTGQGRIWLVSGCSYRTDGTPYDQGNYKWPLEIVAEWVDEPTSPVRTVTRKEIRQGSYGIVNVEVREKGAVRCILDTTDSPNELRAASAVLLELAGAFE